MNNQIIKCGYCHPENPGKSRLGPFKSYDHKGKLLDEGWQNCHICDGKGEYPDTLEFREEHNIWETAAETRELLQFLIDIVDKKEKWRWVENSQCKYIDIRIDMRSINSLLFGRDGEKRITLDRLKYQISNEKDMRYCYKCEKDTPTVNEDCVYCGLSKVTPDHLTK